MILPNLNIPDRYQRGVRLIESLDISSIDAISEALRLAPESLSAIEIASELQKSQPALPKEDVVDVIRTLKAFHTVRNKTEVSLEAFVRDVADSLDDIEGKVFEEQQKAAFSKRLVSLLTIENLSISSKARTLQTEGERAFCSARILTDLRPVFTDDTSAGAKGLVILHQLKLTYHDSSGAHRSFYVTLDPSDLEQFRKTLDRAQEKSEILRGLITDVPILGKA